MPLKIAKERRFTWPVRVTRPDGGKWQQFEFTAHFRAFTKDDLDRLAAGEINGADTIRAHLVGWEGVQDADGQPLAFTDESVSAALSDIDVLRGLMEALAEAVAGGAELKNSKPLPAH